MSIRSSFLTSVGDYRIDADHILGIGDNATVHLASHTPTGNKVAVKIFEVVDPQKRDLARKEVVILKSIFRYEYIIDLLDIFEDREFLYIFLEYASNDHLGSFMQRHGRLDEDTARKFFTQALFALEQCHKNHIAHHDVKLENLLLTSDYSIRLIDFGLSSRVSKGRLIQDYAGSPLYMPPEVFSQQPHNEKVDVWGLGVCLYYMVTESFPFPADNYQDLEEKILFEDVSFPKHILLPDSLKDLIRLMLTKDPYKRPPLKELRKHRWIKSHPRPLDRYSDESDESL